MRLLVLAAMVVCGCSSTPSASGTGGGGHGDTASSSGGSGGGGAPDGGTSENVGALFALSDSTLADGGSVDAYRAGAFFVHRTGVDHSTTQKTVGPCVIERFGSGKPAREKDASAGAVHFTGGLKSLDLVPGPTGAYATLEGTDTKLWQGGETLTFAADGAEVPGFSATLTAPSTLQLTGPALTAGSLSVPRDAPFQATWTGGASGHVVVYFDVATADSAFAATCTFDASAGSAQVPPAAFADFPAGDGSFLFYAEEITTAAPSGWKIPITVSTKLVDGSGAPAAGFSTYL